MTAAEMIEALKKAGNRERAAHSTRFFKTGRGEYGEGDVFLGITVPRTRKIAKFFRGADLEEYETLLGSPYHEARLLALVSLVEAFKRGDEKTRQDIYELYMRNTGRVNNWDLVDTSAPHIAGAWLQNRNRSILYRMARSDSLWERRISIIATQCFIRNEDFQDTLGIADILLKDREDLIHKAVGWMLREVGKRNRKIEEGFLLPRYEEMPRTMLRYAIEKFEPETRRMYLQGLL